MAMKEFAMKSKYTKNKLFIFLPVALVIFLIVIMSQIILNQCKQVASSKIVKNEDVQVLDESFNEVLNSNKNVSASNFDKEANEAEKMSEVWKKRLTKQSNNTTPVEPYLADSFLEDLELLGLNLVPEDMDRLTEILRGFDEGRRGTAKKELKQQIERDPANPLWQLGLGICYSRTSLDMRSQKHLDKSIELVPDFYDRSIENFILSWYKYYAACNKLRSGKPKEAEALLQELVMVGTIKYYEYAVSDALIELNKLREKRGLPPIN